MCSFSFLSDAIRTEKVMADRKDFGSELCQYPISAEQVEQPGFMHFKDYLMLCSSVLIETAFITSKWLFNALITNNIAGYSVVFASIGCSIF
jgi:hypothetical protein